MMDQRRPKYIGVFLGVLYGIITRLAWEVDALQNVGDIVSFTFMFLVPFVIGFIRIHYECKAAERLSYGRMIIVAWQPILVFLLVCVVTLLEGSICIAMALPAFMFFASLGGLVAGGLNRYMSMRNNGTLLSIAVIPLLIAPLEVNFLKLSNTYEVENTIVIHAPVDVVWSQLTNVSKIEKNEQPFSLTSFIGVPRPIEANMNASGVGAVRISRWEKNVEFKEVITDWIPNQRMAYFFDIDPNAIPDNAMDKHVKLGGEYFSPLRGEYYLTKGNDGNTVLHLKTTLLDSTNFGFYSRIWGEIIFQDFHISLLKLMKSRSEQLVQNRVARGI